MYFFSCSLAGWECVNGGPGEGDRLLRAPVQRSPAAGGGGQDNADGQPHLPHVLCLRLRCPRGQEAQGPHAGQSPLQRRSMTYDLITVAHKYDLLIFTHVSLLPKFTNAQIFQFGLRWKWKESYTYDVILGSNIINDLLYANFILIRLSVWF